MSDNDWARKKSAEEREALKLGLTVYTEEELQVDAALYEESLENQYGDPHQSVGQKWEPQRLIRPGAPGRDGLPTIDDDPSEDVHVFPRVYPAWGPGETFVVSGPLGDHVVPEGQNAPAPGGRRRRGKVSVVNPDLAAGVARGRFFRTRKDARKWALEKYGYIFEEVFLKGRWCLRVPMPGPAGAKHRPGGK